MAVKSYNFASPGIFLNEVDQSQIPEQPAPVGPVIIGRAQRGPAMRPVTVASYDEFVQTFGDPVAGGDSSGDVWRSGIPAGPTYGPYAAQAWLANNPTVTFIRLLGVQSETATSTNNANEGYTGWTVGTPATGSTGGAYGLFVFPSQSANNISLTGSLAAVWYSKNSVPVLRGTPFGGSGTSEANGLMISSDPNGAFAVKISGTLGTDLNLTKSFDFNPSSGKFIRKVFNTNPQNVNTDAETGLDTDGTNTNYFGYWLGETFENDYYLNAFSGSTAISAQTSPSVGIIMPLNYFGDKRLQQEAEGDYTARTGWIISQVAQGQMADYDPATKATKLFRFIALDGGDWIRNNLKVTINNIIPPQNDAQRYATFDVEIRRIYDTDANKKIVESFSGCTLDSTSPNYIARKIGDYQYTWDDTTRRLNQKGTYPNNSKFIRVEMADDDLASSFVPFGVLGPLKYTAVSTTGAGLTTNTGFVLPSSSCFAASSVANFTASGATVTGQKYAFAFPSVRTRVSSSEDGLTTFKLADWGASTTRGVSSILYNEGINDLLRVPVTGTSNFASGLSGNGLTYAWTFSLDNIVLSGTLLTGSVLTNPYYYYSTTGKSGGSSFTATGSAVYGGTFDQLLNNGVNSFTTVFQGGTDGFNILEKEPLRNTVMDSNSTNNNNYVYYTYRRAIDTVVDPEFVQANMMAIPGLVFEPLTQYLTQIAEQRGDVLAVIDCSGDQDNEASYVTPFEYSADNYTGDRAISVDAVVNQIKGRNLNTSYGATYYPWVQIADSNSGKIVTVPPSIPAIGAMSYTDAVQAPWFAPAGFNRGGLSTGNAGVNVVNVVKKLNQADRDKLYLVNINPITSFPNEGIVIFGQKTLQAVPSALDRINVRRLMIYIKRGIGIISNTILFEPNVENTWNNFKDKAEPFLADVKSRFGLEDYKLILDSTTTTPDLVDQNILYAKIFLKPARAIEFIAIDFFITRSGANFNG